MGLRLRRRSDQFTTEPMHDRIVSLVGTAMPLDPLAKRLISMLAASAPIERSRPTVHERRQSLAKLMQLARAEAPGVASTDGSLPGPAGDISYRLYSLVDDASQARPGFVFF